MTECKWKEEEPDCAVYVTSCDQSFQLIEGTPKENEFNYCCYCGGLLIDTTKEKP